MRIWRVETNDGTGAYTATTEEGNSVIYGDKYLAGSEQHPGPWGDKGIKAAWRDRGDIDYFGFTSRKAFEAWFDEDLREICQPYLGVSEYYVPAKHVIEGDKQCLFDRGKAKLLKRSAL